MAKNEVAVVDEADAFELAADLRGMAEADSGRGSENVTAQDIAIPYIGILQALSPQCQEGTPEFHESFRPGMFYQNVNGLVWDTKKEGPLEIVPCAFDRKIVEWIPRDAGGGLVAVHETNTPLMREAKPNDKKIPTLPNGHNLIDTSTHYVLYYSPITEEFEPAVISMKSTAQKKSRLWNSLISQQFIPGTKSPAPRWLFRWDFTTAIETSGDNRWYNFEIARGKVVDQATYLKAKGLNESFKAGTVVVADQSGGGNVIEDEIPF
jgi:hypothetical protein